jgi:hypothetical protein
MFTVGRFTNTKNKNFTLISRFQALVPAYQTSKA